MASTRQIEHVPSETVEVGDRVEWCGWFVTVSAVERSGDRGRGNRVPAVTLTVSGPDVSERRLHWGLHESVKVYR